MRPSIKSTLSILLLLFPVWAYSEQTYQYLPEVNQYISDSIGKDCTTVQRTDYDSWVFQFTDPHPQVLGDFDGNGLEDVALIVKCPGKGVSVTAFHRFEQGFKHFVLEAREETFSIKEVLAKEGPGHVIISMGDQPKETTNIEHPAIAVEWMETCYEAIYIWVNGKYKRYYRGL